MKKQSQLLDRMVGLTATVLNLDSERIRTDVHVQDLGFTSITLVELADLLSGALDDEIHPGVFFEYTTLEQLESYLVEEKPDAVARCLAEGRPQHDSVEPPDNPPSSGEDGWAAIEEEFLRSSGKGETRPVTTEDSPLDDLPVLIGGGIAGLLISRELCRHKIPHILIGKPLLGDSPKLGESMTESVTIEFLRNYKEYSQYFHPKEYTPFFMSDMVSGLRFHGFKSMASLFLDEDEPESFIHVDRIGFDEALYRDVSGAKECRWIDELVERVDYDKAADRVTSIRLKNGQTIRPSFVWDCTNHIRLLGRSLEIPFRNFDAPREVFFTHYFMKDSQPLCRREDVPWVHATSLLRADAVVDQLAGVSWLIPLGRYVSVGISMRPEDAGDLTPEEVITRLTRAYQVRGLDYTKYFPRRKEIVRVPSQHFIYDRVAGKNWALVGGSGSSTWFTSGSNISIIACMATMADKIVKEPEIYGEHYSRHVAGFTKTQEIYDQLLDSALGPVDAMKFLSGVVERGRQRIASFFMYRDGLTSETARRASKLWHEDVVIDKTYFQFLRQIATHAIPEDRSRQTEAIFAKLTELERQNENVRIPYLRDDEIRRKKPDLFL